MSVGSFKNWVSPYWDVKLRSLAPSGVVLLVEHYLSNLVLKASMMIVAKCICVYNVPS